MKRSTKPGQAVKTDASSEERLVPLRIVCIHPPDPAAHAAAFGLQDAGDNLDPGKRQSDGSYYFECALRVQVHPRTKQPNFLGPLTHGTPGERFLYLSWRRAEDEGSYARRMKIHLSPITWELIEEAERQGGVLEVSVSGTGRDRGLNSGSVPLLGDGWAVRPR